MAYKKLMLISIGISAFNAIGMDNASKLAEQEAQRITADQAEAAKRQAKEQEDAAFWRKAIKNQVEKDQQAFSIKQNSDNKKEIKIQAMNILTFARKDDHSEYHISAVGWWLNKQRINISDDQEWNWLIQRLHNKTKEKNEMIEELKGDRGGLGKANALTKDILKIVKNVAYNLKPNEDCSTLLVDRANEAVKKQKLILEYGPYYQDYFQKKEEQI